MIEISTSDVSNYLPRSFILFLCVLAMATMSAMTLISDTTKARVYDARTTFMSCMRDKGILTAIVGGGMLGAGMTVAGTVSFVYDFSYIPHFLHGRGERGCRSTDLLSAV